ncbi:SURF1 family protein [Novosphingobium sp. 9]|uniref:SURF1 family protein n=1 Tax=Novosphingobium sp. 9 TaxID=2025349 RepID=UPI0021B623E2|nr:SURF1 family protein [Novosphingobium sp. 9]
MTVLLLLAACVFVALGIWQVHRLAWKEALIARVDARVHAAPVALPPSAALDAAAASDDSDSIDYLRVRFSGIYDASGTALALASTDLGRGYWVMTPMLLDGDRKIYVNRGFVPDGTKPDSALLAVPNDKVEVVGLLRSNEPKGSLLQSNRPAQDRWYSRDVLAMAIAHKVGAVDPAFVDAQTPVPAKGAGPVPGLTVISFPNSHLSYLLTWFAMAALSLAGIVVIWRRREPWSA